MMQTYISLSNIFLMCSSLIFSIPSLSKLLGFFKLLILMVMVILFVSPIPFLANATILTVLHGLIGNLSSISFIFFLLVNINIIFETRIILLDKISAFIILVSGLILYISYLTIIKYDIYKIGYFSNYFIMIIIIIAIGLFFINKLMSWAILIACLSFYFQIQTSNNIWDYLIDPVLFVIAIYTLFFKKQPLIRDDLIYNY